MPTYLYKARDTTGKPVKGTMEAANKAEIIDKLHKMGYMTTYAAESVSGTTLESIFERLKRITAADMLMFYIQFSNMINAGLPILTGLDTLSKQLENKRLKTIVGDVSRCVEAGDSLSQTLAAHPRIFPRLFVNMVKAGEASGKLDAVLIKYAEFFEHQEDLKQKVRGALLYPAILLCAGVAVTLFIVTFIIPQFARIYMEAGVRLPVPTLIVYKVGMAIKDYWYLLIGFIIVISLGVKYSLKTKRGTLIFDTLKLRMPIVGPLHRKVAISRFTRTLGTLVASGVPILESLDITKEVMENVVLSRVIENVRGCVEKGQRMAEPLRVSEEFPPDVVQMVSTGEETGNLDEMLNKTADFYDITVGYAVKKLTTVIEPVFLIIMGCMVGFIMASMLMPIFDMIKTLRH